MATATERWTERELWEERQAAGLTVWRATIAYDVIDAATEADALSAVPTIGVSHPQYGDALTLNSRNPRKRGFNYWVVTTTYSSDSGGGNVASRIPKLRWSHDLVIEEVDRDFDGHAITNSVGDPPANSLTNEFYDLTLTYRRFEPEFNLRKSLSYLGKVNKDSFSIVSGQGFDAKNLQVNPGECKCVEFAPVGEYDAQGVSATGSNVEILYGFRIRERIQIAGSKFVSGFDWRILDQGYRGRWKDGETLRLGDFYHSASERASDMVKLDGTGFPVGRIGRTIGVTRSMHDAVGADTPPGATLDDRYKDQDAVFLVYQRNKRTAFRGLIPLFR